jgi:hypothetical protein
MFVVIFASASARLGDPAPSTGADVATCSPRMVTWHARSVCAWPRIVLLGSGRRGTHAELGGAALIVSVEVRPAFPYVILAKTLSSQVMPSPMAACAWGSSCLFAQVPGDAAPSWLMCALCQAVTVHPQCCVANNNVVYTDRTRCLCANFLIMADGTAVATCPACVASVRMYTQCALPHFGVPQSVGKD